MKRPQNIIAESGLSLPAMVVYGVGIWLAKGLIPDRLWLQMGTFFLAVYLMVELSNGNALLRIRSRMVSCTFIALSCAASFLFTSLEGNLLQIGIIASLLFLFQTYQDPLAVGKTYYAFFFWGLCTTICTQMFLFVPLLWILMATQLRVLSVKIVIASLLGIATPYWMILAWGLFKGDASWIANHFTAPDSSAWATGMMTLTVGQIAILVLTLLLTLVSIVHLWQYGFEDKTRIRLIYGFFCIMTLASTLYIVVQPQSFNYLMRLVIIMASPVIAHFFTLTSHRFTNIFFFVTLAVVFSITVLNLWMPSLTF